MPIVQPSPFTASLIASCGEKIDPVDVHFLRSLSHLVRLRLAVVSRSYQTANQIMIDTCRPYETFADALDAMQRLYVRFAATTRDLSSEMDFLLDLSERVGLSRKAMLRNQRSLASFMVLDYAAIREVIADDPPALEMLEEGKLPEHAGFMELWRLLLDQYGHRGIDEIDIAKPRFAEVPEMLLKKLIEIGSQRQNLPPRTRGTALNLLRFPLARLIWQVSNAQIGFRHSTMFAFVHMRHEFLRLADRAVAAGCLSSREVLWTLDIEQVRCLDLRSADGRP